MPLTSFWFSNDERCERCSTVDSAHMTIGDQGMHVGLVQDALILLDKLDIAQKELAGQSYGPSTAAAVKAYKSKRSIINHAYQNTVDSLVGKMTIASLDAEMHALEVRLFSIAGVSIPFLRGVLFAPRLTPTKKAVVVTEKNAPWVKWARQFDKKFKAIGTDVVEIENGASPDVVTRKMKLAALKAGQGGFIILSVGHGVDAEASGGEDGFFDLAPKGTFKVGGRNSILTPKRPGEAPPANSKGKTVHVNAFYEERIPNPILAGGFQKSRKDEDEASHSSQGGVRLHNWKDFQDIGAAFSGMNVAVILMTCRVAGASGFIKQVQKTWGVPIVAYKRRVVALEQDNGQVRIFLEGDRPGQGTNTPIGEFLFPISNDMLVVQ